MNIAVVSPHTVRNGNTTIASLLAMDISTRGKSVCLAHTALKSPAMYEYFSLRELGDDKTANPSKLVSMLKAGAVKPEEITEYCKNITTNLDAFTVNDKKFTVDDLDYMITYILDRFPYEIKVFDVDNNYDDPITKKVLGKCDFIVLVITQAIIELYDFRSELKRLEKLLKYKPSMIVVNKFDRHICDIKSVQRVLGATVSKKSSWITVRYNPQVVRFENFGKLLDLYNAMRNNDISVIDVASDIKLVGNRVMKCRQQERVSSAKRRTESIIKEAKALEEASGKAEAAGKQGAESETEAKTGAEPADDKIKMSLDKDSSGGETTEE